MKNVSSLKSKNSDSPKTPGGISTSLLTPCRRVGLSRNWKRQGTIPFVSPLSSNSEVNKSKDVEVQVKKRKERVDITKLESEECSNSIDNIQATPPSRDIEVPRRNKSKTLLLSLSQEDIDLENDTKDDLRNSSNKEPCIDLKKSEQTSTPRRIKCINNKKNSTKLTTDDISNTSNLSIVSNSNKDDLILSSNNDAEINSKVNMKVPNNLSKECIVVIQKKIFKNELIRDVCDNQLTPPNSKEDKLNSQVLFDSDSDNEPLAKKHKQETKSTSDDEDFTPGKVKKRNSKANKKPKLEKVAQPQLKPAKHDVNLEIKEKELPEQKFLSQSSFEDDDAFEVDKKRTILIRKTYEKVSKPVKAKSTGSITQKDIDELKARIEAKKKKLLTNCMTEDTKELRDLIKKWQKGCQDALMELMDLMKNKLSDKADLDYSQMLEMLKIPPNLVGYDQENDCFITPEDSGIILANI